MIVTNKLRGALLIASFIGYTLPMAAQTGKTTVEVTRLDIQSGYISRRIDLMAGAKPRVMLSDISYTETGTLPVNAFPTDPSNFDILMGKDRKQPFCVVRVPAYSYDESGKIRQISRFTISHTETSPAGIPGNRSAAKTTGIQNSPLAAGTWYKISVPHTGLFKIDYNFLATQLGVTGISSSQIRLLGHGGKMLPERNVEGGVTGLQDNDIWINDGGDGRFDPGDYLVFFGQGTLNWTANGNTLIQEQNLYSDAGYYFLNFDGVATHPVQSQVSVPAGNITVNHYSAAVLHEQELANPQKFGKLWWGEEFSSEAGKQTSQTFNLDIGDVIDSSEINISVVNTATTPALFTAYVNGQNIGTADISATNNYEYAPKAMGDVISWKTNKGGAFSVRLDYNTSANDGKGWLDYIRINAKKPLSISTGTLLFCTTESVGAGNVTTYRVSGADGNTQVWDVTDPAHPVKMNGSLAGGVFSFSQYSDELHWFAAMNGAPSDEPVYISTVPNQDLFGAGPVDFIIVTHPDLKPAADRLAQFHTERNGSRVIVATTTQVYNEFSSGSQDIAAIRDFARLLYDRAGSNTADMPKYLLLMGDASYDYKNRIKNNTNFVPTFEARESFDFLETYSNDDFFGFLDENEEIERYDIINALDIGVGRIPAKSLQEASDVVNKIIHYKSPATLGAWRLSTLFAADNEDNAGEHLDDAEIMFGTVQQNSKIHNASKVYLDAVSMISTPGGQRAPDANKAINDAIFKGTFLFNYCGHGNTTVLAHERIVTKDDYNKWRNIDKMPFMITATCDFGQFDQPSFVSAGEELMLKSDGGVIATLTTTHLVYAYANEMLNREFLAAQFQHVNGKWNTFGDAMRIGKNSTYALGSSSIDIIKNFRKFTLLGDPALEPDFPEYFVKTTAVKDGATGEYTDTISALGEYIVEGEVTDVNGNILGDFNGSMAVTIFDKPRKIKTITPINKTFRVQNNTIYKGRATVSNGKFSFAFIAPKDINYDMGSGALSIYAENGKTDAAGRDTTIKVGGYSDNPRIENNPPLVRAFIKDSLFRNFGLTGSNTAIFAILEDETGINVSGNAVGHDLVAILDGDVSKPYIMNDYYETAPNTYKRGYVYFPVEGIPPGRHRFTIKAWDVNNNSGEGYVDFEVADDGIVRVQKLYNYPNPFRDATRFVFEHNHPDEDLVAEINIYNTAGVFVRKLNQSFVSTGSKSNEIMWDGTDNNGAKLPAGVYIYRMKISTAGRIETMAYQKLVLVR